MKRLLALAGIAGALTLGAACCPYPVRQMLPVRDGGVEIKVEGIDCPEEDSCDIDYRDGAWYVREVTP